MSDLPKCVCGFPKTACTLDTIRDHGEACVAKLLVATLPMVFARVENHGEKTFIYATVTPVG